MILESVRLRCFRNYQNATLHFTHGVNVLIGENGQGKTNVLEAIYYLSNARSFRAVDDVDMIQFSEDFSNLEAIVSYEQDRRILSALLHKKGKSLMIQNQPVTKVSEFIGKMNAVLFSPSDMSFFESSPKVRRKFMDMEIGKMSNLYINHFSNFSKLLKDRNILLKSDQPNMTLLESITEQMIDPQVYIIKKRTFFIRDINRVIGDIYRKISKTDDTVEIVYDPVVPFDNDEVLMKESLSKKYKEYEQRDLLLRQTNFGIQREDLTFLFNGHPVLVSASQGQQRMMIIAMKIALIDLIQEYTGEYPILLLDDVLSELDVNKQKNLLKMIPTCVQTILTTTNQKDLEYVINRMNVYEIKKGVCEPWKK